MPLIIMCGLPCSGKTRRADEISRLLERECGDSAKVNIVCEDFSSQTRNDLYSSTKEEKIARGNLKSQVERLLSRDTHVILDSLNYIKGYRYELYCLSKLLKTTQCVVHCDTPQETVADWNAQRPIENERYSLETFDALVQRFETPDSRNRWDYPLVTLYPSDPLPEKEILDAILKAKPPSPNQSTQSQPLASVDFLHELDRQTQSMVSKILEFQGQGLLPGSVLIPGTEEKVTLRRHMTMPEMRRYKNQFISYTKLHPVDDVRKISTFFVHYLNSSL